MTTGGLDGDNSTQKRCEKRHQGPLLSHRLPHVTKFSHETGQNGQIWAKFKHFSRLLRDFSRITRPKGGILLVARPAQTRPNGQIPVQNGGMAGL